MTVSPFAKVVILQSPCMFDEVWNYLCLAANQINSNAYAASVPKSYSQAVKQELRT